MEEIKIGKLIDVIFTKSRLLPTSNGRYTYVRLTTADFYRRGGKWT